MPIRLEQNVRDFLFSLCDFPGSLFDLKKGLEEMWEMLEGKKSVKRSDRDKFTQLFFRCGKGIYIGIESRLPSEFMDIFPSWLDMHAEYMNNLSEKEKESGGRILVVDSLPSLRNDKMNKPTNFHDFVSWHEEYKTGLYYVKKGMAEKIRKNYDLESTDVALWEDAYAILFDHKNKEGVNIRLVPKEDSKDFNNIRKYVDEIKENHAEKLDPYMDLLLVEPPLAENWRGYTGSSEDRTVIHDFIHKHLKKYSKYRGKVLDAAAGIGNEVLFLLKKDYSVEVNEVDPTFTKILKKNIDNDKELERRGIKYDKMRVHKKDWRKLAEESVSDISAILVLGNSLSMIVEDGQDERLKCIEQFYDLLVPGGTLIIDERNFPRIIERLKAGEIVYGKSVMYPAKEVDCKLELLVDGQKVKFVFYKGRGGQYLGDIDVAILEKGELKDMLTKAGFQIKVYSDLVREGEDPNANFYTYVATKTKPKIKRELAKVKKRKSLTSEPSEQTIGIGKESFEKMKQWGILGKTEKGSVVKFDLNAPHIVFVCGSRGQGKGYTIGVLSEMLVSLSIPQISKALKKATIIVLHKPREDEKSEFWCITEKNDKREDIKKLKDEYKADPQSLVSKEDLRVFVDPSVSKDAFKEFKKEYGTENIHPLQIDLSTLGGIEWATILSTGSVTSDLYLQTLFRIIRKQKKIINTSSVRSLITSSNLSNEQKDLACFRLDLLNEYQGTSGKDFTSKLALGGVNIFDFSRVIRPTEDIFSVITLILSVLQKMKSGKPFVFIINEAHEYFRKSMAEDLVDNIIYMVRRSRHGANWLLLDTHFPYDVNRRLIELSDVKIVHSMDPAVRDETLSKVFGEAANKFSKLHKGQTYIVPDKSTKGPYQTFKVNIRPRLTKHGGETKVSIEES